jgi:hypothetical protein
MSEEITVLPARQPNLLTPEDLTLANLKQNPNADPVRQLLYAALHARRSLDRLDRSIRKDLKREKGKPDPLFFLPIGQQLVEYQFKIRHQLGYIAKQYVSLGIEERATRMIEDWAAILLPFITALMDDPDLALSRAQREKLPSVVERHLRTMEQADR